MGKMQRNKGARVEREMVKYLQEHDISCERVPLSGAMHYQGNGADIDIYSENLHLKAEVKSRKESLWKSQEKWLGDNDVLILKSNNQEPYVFMPINIFTQLLKTNSPLNCKELKIKTDLFEQVTNLYKVSIDDILSNKKNRQLADARKFMVLVLRRANFTVKKITKILNISESYVTALGGAKNEGKST